MPFEDECFITAMTAQEIANIVEKFYHEPPSKYFKLVITDVRERGRRKLWVRPRHDQEPFRIAGNSQIINCITDGGQEVTIIVPARNRELVPAEVRLAPRI